MRSYLYQHNFFRTLTSISKVSTTEIIKRLNGGNMPNFIDGPNNKVYFEIKGGLGSIGRSESGDPIILYRQVGPKEKTASVLIDALRKREINAGIDGDGIKKLDWAKIEKTHVRGEMGVFRIDRESGDGWAGKIEVKGTSANIGAEITRAEGMSIGGGLEAAGGNIGGSYFAVSTDLDQNGDVEVDYRSYSVEGSASFGYEFKTTVTSTDVELGAKGILGAKVGFKKENHDDFEYLNQVDKDRLLHHAISNKIDDLENSFLPGEGDQSEIEELKSRKAELESRLPLDFTELLAKISSNCTQLKNNVNQ